MDQKLIQTIIDEQLIFDYDTNQSLIINHPEEWQEACEQLSLSYDYLPHFMIPLFQHKQMFRFNTDTTLLSTFMRIHKQDTVLDIGTNNGALLLVASKMTNQELVGVEPQGKACELARQNIKLHQLNNRCQIIEDDICNVDLPCFDVIITNPPYFPIGSQIINPTYKQLARHELTLNLEQLIQQIDRLLKDGGKCYMVHRSDRLPEIITRFQACHMEVKQIQPVYDERKDDARCILIEVVKQAKPGCRLLAPIYTKR